jgi:hypothetical protein
MCRKVIVPASASGREGVLAETGTSGQELGGRLLPTVVQI